MQRLTRRFVLHPASAHSVLVVETQDFIRSF